jgi:hypothetical protein
MAHHWRGMPDERRRHPGTGERRRVLVKPAPSDLPIRWLVGFDDCERPAISIVAVLRQVCETLDPGYATRRVRIGAFPLVPT